ncbi:hypothetical protein C8R46DRAFT_1221971 [Mycena filopes]|nr:hypothetical protein C8R46DRAFT_1221971 [Mycena filopes]
MSSRHTSHSQRSGPPHSNSQHTRGFQPPHNRGPPHSKSQHTSGFQPPHNRGPPHSNSQHTPGFQPPHNDSERSVASPAATYYPPAFHDMSLFNQLTYTFPHFREETLAQEIAQWGDPHGFWRLWHTLKAKSRPGLTFGIPPDPQDRDVLYIAIPKVSYLALRFYPGGTFAAQERLYCMDIYDKHAKTAIAIPSDWILLKQLDLGQELMEYDSAADIFYEPPPSFAPISEAPRRVRLHTLESTFGQEPHVPGKFMVEEKDYCILEREGFEDFDFIVPARAVSASGTPTGRRMGYAMVCDPHQTSSFAVDGVLARAAVGCMLPTPTAQRKTPDLLHIETPLAQTPADDALDSPSAFAPHTLDIQSPKCLPLLGENAVNLDSSQCVNRLVRAPFELKLSRVRRSVVCSPRSLRSAKTPELLHIETPLAQTPADDALDSPSAFAPHIFGIQSPKCLPLPGENGQNSPMCIAPARPYRRRRSGQPRLLIVLQLLHRISLTFNRQNASPCENAVNLDSSQCVNRLVRAPFELKLSRVRRSVVPTLTLLHIKTPLVQTSADDALDSPSAFAPHIFGIQSPKCLPLPGENGQNSPMCIAPAPFAPHISDIQSSKLTYVHCPPPVPRRGRLRAPLDLKPSSSRPLLATPAVVGTGVRSASTMVVFDPIRSCLSRSLLHGHVTSSPALPASRAFSGAERVERRSSSIPLAIVSVHSSSPPTGSLFTIYDRRAIAERRTLPHVLPHSRHHHVATTMSIIGVREFVLALVVAVQIRRPPTDGPLRRPLRIHRFVGRLRPFGRRCIIRVKQAAGVAPTLKAVQNLRNPRKRETELAVHIQHRDSYALEGPGLVYVCAVVDNDDLTDFDAGTITHAEFFATLCVKIRCTEDLVERRCDKGQTHLWLRCFRVERRCVGERVCHLLCGYELDCQGYPVMQRDYCKLWRLRSFSWIKETMKEAFAKLGEPALVPIGLEDEGNS